MITTLKISFAAIVSIGAFHGSLYLLNHGLSLEKLVLLLAMYIAYTYMILITKALD